MCLQVERSSEHRRRFQHRPHCGVGVEEQVRPAGCFQLLSLLSVPAAVLWAHRGPKCGAAPGPQGRQVAHLEGPTAVRALPLAPLPTAHEHVIAGVPEARHEVVALSVGVHFEL